VRGAATVAVLCASLALAGCASGSRISLPSLSVLTASAPNPVTAEDFAAIESAYGVALAGAVAYRNRPLCKKTALESVSNLCARRSIIVRMQDADRRAQVALGSARVFIRDNPTLDAGALISAAKAAVGAFTQIQSGAL
jgi:hypothetical protein